MAQRLGIRRPRVAGRPPAGALVKVANGYTSGPTSLPGGATIPGGSYVTDATSMLGALQNRTAMGVNGTTPLPRDQQFWALMGPGAPLFPAPFNLPNPQTGQADPRRYEYPISSNITQFAGRLVDWTTLRSAAREVDLIAECIRVRRTEQASLEWDITLSKRAVQVNNLKSADDKATLLAKYDAEVGRLTDFWSEPDTENGYTWPEWLEILVQELLVTDAPSIYPVFTYGGDLCSLRLIDGATVKPLLDEYGNRPRRPAPAYQQWLYGFPRGEYVDAGAGDPDWEGAAGSLIYKPRYPRVDSPYGYSPVEQCLVSADLWLRRQQWMVAEYTAGTAPRTFLKSNLAGYTPEQLRGWEDALNDYYGGSTDRRHRLKLLPEGFDPSQVEDAAERYKPDYDEFLVKLICAHMGVQPQEIGFTPRNGLGGAGHGESQEAITYRKALRPTAQWLVGIMNQISYAYLGMPKDLTFRFLGLDEEGETDADALTEKQVRSARMTLNEARDETGRPRYPFAEADMPMLMTERGVVFLENASTLVPAGEMVVPVQAPKETAPPEQTDGSPAAPDEEQPEPDKKAAKAPKATSKADSRHDARQVIEQVAEDYPPDAMTWIDRYEWRLRTVPLAEVDFSNAKDWQASHEPEKVAKFARKIAKGKRKPVILVRTPGASLYTVVDGHHRSLAYRQLDEPVTAWTAEVDAKTGPWDEMHASQFHGPSGSTANSKADGVTPAATEEARKAELAAYWRWSKKPHNRPFEFAAVTKTEAMLHEIPLDRVVFKAGGGEGKARTRHWPGWEQDQAVAKHWARALSEALTGAIDARALALEWLEVRKAVGVTDALHWLHHKAIGVARTLGRVLGDVYAEGYLVGQRSAKAVVANTVPSWDNWTPGDPAAARALIGEDMNLARLLSNADVTIQSIADNRLDDLAQVLADGLDAGDSVDTLASALAGVLDDPQWAYLVAQTETTRAVAFATQQSYLADGIVSAYWFTAEDQRVCPACDANEAYGANTIGVDFPSGQSAPPAHPMCLPGDTLVLARSRITAATSRIYEGELVGIRTLTGKEFRATPNHPVLTDAGWVPAGLLKPGDKVVSAVAEQWPPVADKHNQNVPVPIKQVAEAFLGSGGVTTREVPVTTEDFHGDGAGSEVAVVGAYGGLLTERYEPLGEHHGECVLKRTDSSAPRLAAGSYPAALIEPLDSTTRGGMRRLGQPGTFDRIGSSHADIHAGAAPTRLDARLHEPKTDDPAGDGVALAERLLADSGLVQLDELANVQRNAFHGPVFNLETDDGWYIGNGIVTHNCRCSLLPVLE